MFNIASNTGTSSSLYDPLEHIKFYPHIEFSTKIKVDVKKASTLITNGEININNYNVLFIDAQGSDLQILRSFKQYITNIELIIIEYINSKLYIGIDNSLDNIKNFLTNYNFTLQECFGKEINGAGNATFIKKHEHRYISI